jgi:hypothetical protein
MPQETLAQNPFMMMLNPEIVLAAVERSEKLGRLNRRMCHPLDKLVIVPAAPEPQADGLDDDADTADDLN